MHTYKTSEVAKIIGIHPNTVRLYEKLGLIPKPERGQNGYRIFTEYHITQCRLTRAALKTEIVQNGLRKQAIDIIKTAAAGRLEAAESRTQSYLQQLRSEQKNAEKAIETVQRLLSGDERMSGSLQLTRKQTADYLRITIDTLRNWELNGLLTVKRKQNGYRVYTDEDIQRLRIIRALRCANYSLSAILRMLHALSRDPRTNIRKAIDTPEQDEDIISVCDQLLTSLRRAEENAQEMLMHIDSMKKLNPPF